MPDTEASAGAPKFSLALGAKKSLSSTPLRNKRPLSALEEDGVEVEDGRHEEISGFDKDSKQFVKAARVIQSVPDVDWKTSAQRKRQKSGLPTAQTQNGVSGDADAKVEESSLKFGLTVVDRTSGSETAARMTTPPPEHPASEPRKTVDEEAIEALINGRRQVAKAITPPSEEEAFKESYEYAPPAPTARDFAATPVEGFGAAILRGYLKSGRTLEDHGYNEGGKDEVTKRRPGLLGLGAKESGMGVELGAWGKGAKGQKGEGYIPLARKNHKTGEILTDEELRAKLEAQKADERNGVHVDANKGRRDHKRNEERGYERRRLEGVEEESSRNDKYYRDKERHSDRKRDTQERERDREYDRKRDRRKEDDEKDDYRRGDERSDDHDRKSRNKDHDEKHDSHRRRGYRRYEEEDDNRHSDRRRRRSRSADGQRDRDKYRSSRRH